MVALFPVASQERTNASTKRIHEHGWDADRPYYTLTAANVIAATGDFLAGRIDAQELQYWAECFEGREDVAFEGGENGAVETVVFWLLRFPKTPSPGMFLYRS